MVLLSSRNVMVSEVNKRGGEEPSREVVVLDNTHVGRTATKVRRPLKRQLTSTARTHTHTYTKASRRHPQARFHGRDDSPIGWRRNIELRCMPQSSRRGQVRFRGHGVPHQGTPDWELKKV